MIIEAFRSIQGEGKTQGVNSTFIHFSECNASCSICSIPLSDIKEMIDESDNIVFTGGEPLINKNFEDVMSLISNASYLKSYEIETNGTLLIPKDFLYTIRNINKKLLFNISPQTNVMQEKNDILIEPILIMQLKEISNSNIDYIVKFLFKDEEDLIHIEKVRDKYQLEDNKIWCQPYGVNSETLKKIINDNFNNIIKRNWNISLRSHIFLFENKRGGLKDGFNGFCNK